MISKINKIVTLMISYPYCSNEIIHWKFTGFHLQ